jgi:hypothetical protein
MHVDVGFTAGEIARVEEALREHMASDPLNYGE